MGQWKIQIPKPSAKRLEKDRVLIIEEHGAFHLMKYRFPILEGESEFHFEFEFRDTNPYISEGWQDRTLSYIKYVECRNSTGSRVEQIKVELEEMG